MATSASTGPAAVCLDIVFPLHSGILLAKMQVNALLAQQLQEYGTETTTLNKYKGFLAKVAKHNDFLNLKKSQSSSREIQSSKAPGTSRRSLFQILEIKRSRKHQDRQFASLVLVGSQGDEVAAMGHGGDGGIWIRAAVAVAAGGAIAARAVRRKSVDFSAVFVGVPAMVAHTVAGYRFAGLLLVFFFTSSRVTRVGEARKRALDPEFKEGGQRNWKQVLSNSGIASILVVMIALVTEGTDRCLDSKESALVTALIGGVIGHYACCNGDTWSSELGILSKAEPRIITTFKRVRKGTNGGVTIDGLLAAAAAGFSIGLAFVLIGFLTTQCASDIFWRQLLVIPLATAAGLCGSLIDSILGATVQYSGFCSVRKKVVGVDGPTVTRISGMNILDNNGVNVVSVTLTTVLTAVACTYIF